MKQLISGGVALACDPHWPSRRLGQWVSFPEVKALHDAIEANKAAAARCKEKVAQVEGAMANTAIVLNL